MLSVVCKNPGQTLLLIILAPVAQSRNPGLLQRADYGSMFFFFSFSGASVMYIV